MSDRPVVLIAGVGEVGRYVLEFLAREGVELDIVVGDVDLPSLRAKVDNALFGAALQGREPRIRAIELDLLDVEGTAAVLAEAEPTVVMNCAVLQTWHAIRRLPEEVYARLSSAGLGAWLPVQLTLAMRLGQAIERSGIPAHYINTSLSDLTNPVLRAMGLNPTVGIGNVALIESALRTLVARRLETQRRSVAVKLVAHHVHWVTWREAGYREGAPFFLQIVVDGEDTTAAFDPLELMKEAILLYPTGTSFSAVSASSAIANLKALLSEEEVRTHSPGPNGLPGGYPVKISRQGVALDLPEGISRNEAIRLNEVCHTFDGVQEIGDDARVRFTPYAVEVMREVLGFDCESFLPDDCQELAFEQMRRFRKLEQKHLES